MIHPQHTVFRCNTYLIVFTFAITLKRKKKTILLICLYKHTCCLLGVTNTKNRMSLVYRDSVYGDILNSNDSSEPTFCPIYFIFIFVTEGAVIAQSV